MVNPRGQDSTVPATGAVRGIYSHFPWKEKIRILGDCMAFQMKHSYAEFFQGPSIHESLMFSSAEYQVTECKD